MTVIATSFPITVLRVAMRPVVAPWSAVPVRPTIAVRSVILRTRPLLLVARLRSAVVPHVLPRHRTVVAADVVFRPRHRPSRRVRVRISGSPCRHYVRSMELRWTRRGCNRWTTVILRSQEGAISARHVLVITLALGHLEVMFALRSLLLAGFVRDDTAAAAVVADTIDRDVVDDRLVVDVNIGDGYIVHGTVVIEVTVPPVSAVIAGSEVAKAVVHTAIETNVRSPVACVPNVHPVTPPPISRRPEQANRRRHDPGARHPVIAIGTIRPVAWRPNISIARARRLRVDRQHGRSNRHRHKHSGKGGCGENE